MKCLLELVLQNNEWHRKICCLVTECCPALFNDCSPPGSCPWDFLGKNTRVCCHLLHQGIFPNQRSNLCLLHLQADSLPLSHLEAQCQFQPTGLSLLGVRISPCRYLPPNIKLLCLPRNGFQHKSQPAKPSLCVSLQVLDSNMWKNELLDKCVFLQISDWSY